jgi:hypothetical protein
MRLSRRRCRGRVAATFAAVAGALVVASAASAASYEWQGWVGINPSRGNGNCVNWYPSQSACSGWAYWKQLNAANSGVDRVLAGFQNHGTIRGVYLNSGQSAITYPEDHNMGGYLQSGVTYCTWSPCVVRTGDAYVWFKAWN